MADITIKEIAQGLGEAGYATSPAMVRYYLTSRSIQPTYKIGATNLYDVSTVGRILDILQEPKAKAEPVKVAPKSKAKTKPKAKAKAAPVEEEDEAPAAPVRRRRRRAEPVEDLDLDTELDEL